MKEKARSDREVCISIGKIEGEAQVTSNDTGWSEEEKERMRQAGYDDMDIIREWYSLAMPFIFKRAARVFAMKIRAARFHIVQLRCLSYFFPCQTSKKYPWAGYGRHTI